MTLIGIPIHALVPLKIKLSYLGYFASHVPPNNVFIACHESKPVGPATPLKRHYRDCAEIEFSHTLGYVGFRV